MEQKPLEKFTDLELAKASGQLYTQLMQIQSNLIMVNQEIEKRTPKVEVIKPNEVNTTTTG